MLRRVFATVLLLLFGVIATQSQSFQKEFLVTGSTSVVPYSIAQRPDGCFLVSYLVREDALRLHVSCMGPDGTVLWSTRLNAHFNGDDASEGIKKTPIMATADNSCIVLVSKSLISTGQGWSMVKLSPDGVIEWNREVTGVGSVSDLLGYSQGRIYLLARYWSFDSKPYMACLDDNGDVIWEQNVQSNLDNIVATGIRILSNQNILVSLAESDFLHQVGHIARLNSNGVLVNLLSLPDLSFMGADIHPDGRLFFLARTLDSINLKNQVLLGVAKNGQVQWMKAIDIPQDFYFSGMLTLNAAADSITVSFRASLLEAQRYWIRFDLNGSPGATHFMPSGETSGSEIIPTLNGGFAWVSTGQSTGNLSSYVVSKTNSSALLDECPAASLCGMTVRDTFFATQALSEWHTQPVSRIVTGMATQQARSLTSNDFCIPLPVLDASIIAVDTVTCGIEPFSFQRLPQTTGLSRWSFPGGSPSAFEGAEPPKIVFQHTGTYQVRHILNQAGCLDTAYLTVRVADNPQTDLPSEAILCPNQSITIQIQGLPGLNYHWEDGATGPSRSFTAPGRYVLSASSAEGCHRSDTITVTLPELPATLFHADTFFCADQTVTVNLGASAGWQYQWADGYSDPERIFSEAGAFGVQAVSPEGCVLNGSIQVMTKEQPDISIDTQESYDCGARRLTARGFDLRLFEWNTGDTSAVISVNMEGTYTVIASNGFCNNSKTAQVDISPCPECFVYIPGVFKPSSVNGNDVFRIQSACGISEFFMEVYDRWGNLVFSSHDVNEAWDGRFNARELPPGVYIYRLQMMLDSGDKVASYSKTGDISIVR